jgi:hypothetical protein
MPRQSSVRTSAALLLTAAVVGIVGPARAQNAKACIKASDGALALSDAGKLLEARTKVATCAASTCPDVVRTSCQQRLAELGRAIPSVILFAKDKAGSDLTAVRLTIDGAIVAERLDARAIELDPGEHQLRLEAAGQPPIVRRLVLHEGEHDRREDVVFGSSASQPASSSSDSAQTGGAQRTIGWVVGGVGVAALATGSVFGLLAISAHASYEQHCGPDIGSPAGVCDPTGVAGQSDASTKATASTILFIGGGVATALGLTLLLTAPSSRADQATGAQLDVGPGAVFVKGRF